MKFDRLAGGKEDHDFLGFILLEESEEKKESSLRRTYHIALRGEEGEGRGERERGREKRERSRGEERGREGGEEKEGERERERERSRGEERERERLNNYKYKDYYEMDLFQTIHCGIVLMIVHAHIERSLAEGHTGKILHITSLCG